MTDQGVNRGSAEIGVSLQIVRIAGRCKSYLRAGLEGLCPEMMTRRLPS